MVKQAQSLPLARSRHRRTNYNEKYQENFDVKMLLLGVRPRGFVSLSCSNCLASRRKPRTRYAYSAFSSASSIAIAFSRSRKANFLHSVFGSMA
jgi:hypothetical protein